MRILITLSNCRTAGRYATPAALPVLFTYTIHTSTAGLSVHVFSDFDDEGMQLEQTDCIYPVRMSCGYVGGTYQICHQKLFFRELAYV